jgi:hypothetical protein
MLLSAMRAVVRHPVRIGGTRVACQSEQDHRLRLFAQGRHTGHDGIVRDLRILMCVDCESVCVRDVTLDSLPTPRRRPLRRRDHVLGWYSGARRGQRQYR